MTKGQRYRRDAVFAIGGAVLALTLMQAADRDSEAVRRDIQHRAPATTTTTTFNEVIPPDLCVVKIGDTLAATDKATAFKNGLKCQ